MQNDTTIEIVASRIDRMPFSRWHAGAVAILGGSHLMDGFDVTALAFVLPVLVHLWRLTPAQAGILIAATAIGQMAGSVSIGLWAERQGRRRALRTALSIIGVASLACAFAPGYAVLLLLRILEGFGLGGEAPVAATYMSELAPARLRGRMVMGIQLLFGVGTVVSSILARVLIPHFGWRSMFVVGVLPILLAMALRRLLPESPRWLAARGRDREAEAAVAGIERRVFKGALPAAPAAAVPAFGLVGDRQPITGSRLGLLLGGALRAATLSAWLLAFTGNLVGYALIVWMPTLYTTVYHLPITRALSFSAIGGIFSLFGAVLGLLLVDPLGRKPTLSLSCLAAAVCLIGLAIGGATMDPVYVVALATLAAGFSAIPLSAIYLYVPELYPTPTRAFGIGIASAWGRMALIVGPLIIGATLTFGSVRGVYAFLAVTIAIGGSVLAVFGRETALSGPQAR